MPTDASIAIAAEKIKSGGIVVFPTETVYGLGGNARDPRAVAKIFALKKRPRFNPLIVHAPDAKTAFAWGTFPPLAQLLARKFWPGPLTLVVPKKPGFSELVSAGLETIGFRVPRHPTAQALLRAAGIPIAAPSANLFQTLSATRVENLSPELVRGADLVLDGGPCAVGLESTILGFDTNGNPILLRPGGLALEAIEALVGPVGSLAEAVLDPTKPPAPGMLKKHYAPRTPLRLIKGTERTLPAGKVGLLCLRSPEDPTRFAQVESLSATGDLTEAAGRFFAALSRLDGAGLSLILAETFPNQGLGLAINDRLRRAANCEDI